jgi:hypothetical protein
MLRPTSKYRNHRVTIDGRTFASKLEAGRYSELKLMENAGLIYQLACQVPFRFEIQSILICKYIADFTYRMADTSVLMVEDAKGFETPEYKLKKKLMLAIHGIEIQEFKKKRKS